MPLRGIQCSGLNINPPATEDAHMTTLLESGARPYGSSRGIVLSTLFHGVLITAAILGTAQVFTPAREAIEQQSLIFVAPPPPEVHVAPDPVPEVKSPPRAAVPTQAEPARPRPVQPRPQVAATPALVAPTKVPVAIPAIDLSAPPTISDVVAPPVAASEFGAAAGSAVGAAGAGGSATGSATGLGSGAAGEAYAENQVERIVEVTRAAAPRFPDALRNSGIEGEVHVTYIVGTNGRVEPGSIRILDSPHRLFGESVQTALLDARYRPAQVGGRSVRQLVAQSFSFRISR